MDARLVPWFLKQRRPIICKSSNPSFFGSMNKKIPSDDSERDYFINTFLLFFSTTFVGICRIAI